MSTERRKPYPFDQIEPKWQARWDGANFHAPNPGENGFDSEKPKVLHPRHVSVSERRGFARRASGRLHGHGHYRALQTLRGFNVLHPMGWDAFGLPAEQYAIKTGQHPRKTTEENIATFKRQIKSLGFSYDW